MRSHSIVFIAGNLTSKPRFRFAGDNVPVCDGTLAVNHQFKRLEESIEEVTYVDFTALGGLAKALKEVEKGAGLYCEGRLKSESWTDKQSGKKKFKLKVIAERLRRIPGRNPNATEPITAAKSE